MDVATVKNTIMQTLEASSEVKVFQPCGYINASSASEWQQQLVTAIASKSFRSVLVDMSQVESLDSAGLMALVSALELAQCTDQSFALCSVSPATRIVFELTQLDRVFEIVENQAAFLAQVA